MSVTAAAHSCSVQIRLVLATSQLGLQWFQVFVVRLVDLCFVQWGFLGPLKQVFIHIPVIAAKYRAKGHVLKIKRINQSNGIGANQSEQLLHTLVDLGDLRLCHDLPLKEISSLLTDSIQRIQETQIL